MRFPLIVIVPSLILCVAPLEENLLGGPYTDNLHETTGFVLEHRFSVISAKLLVRKGEVCECVQYVLCDSVYTLLNS